MVTEPKDIGKSTDQIIEERQKTYGWIGTNSSFAIDTIRGWHKARFNSGYPPFTREIENIAVEIIQKLSRLACGDLYDIDGWKDIEGFARKAQEVAELEKSGGKPWLPPKVNKTQEE
jgi:hypothetical protein